MATQTKPSIVFAHGIWADGSCFSKVIPALQADGYEVMAREHSLDTLEGDVATITRTLGRVRDPRGAGRGPVQPEGRRHCLEVDSSHIPMLSNPGLVVDVIRTAAHAVR